MRLKIDKENRDMVRDLIAETFFLDERETLKMFEQDLGRIYKLMEETPVTNDTQKNLLEEAITDREDNLLWEIIEAAADNLVVKMSVNEDTDW